MKKLLKNKKGFTLVELLAVIVVLAIIMVIAATSVTNAIATSRLGSYKSAYKMLEKDIKQRVISQAMNAGDTIVCSAADCPTYYDLSSADYTMVVTGTSDGAGGYVAPYIFTLEGKGKFADVKISSDNDCPVSGATVASDKGCKNGTSKIKVKIDSVGKVTADTVS